MADAHHHRSLFGGKNKPFKGKSKGKVKRMTKGKVEDDDRVGVKSRNFRDAGSRKKQMRNFAKQLQKERRTELMRAKRIGSRDGPPRIIAFVPISKSANVSGIRTEILRRAQTVQFFNEKKRQYSCEIEVDDRRRKYIFLDPNRDAVSVLDAAKAADILVPVISFSSGNTLDVDGFSDHLITILKAQGLPTIIGAVIPPTKALKPKALKDGLKLSKRWFASALESPKVVVMDKSESVSMLLRNAATAKLSEIAWRAPRPFLLAESLEFKPDSTNGSTGILVATGYLRGDRGLSANQLVHITGSDDFQVQRIWELPRSSSSAKSSKSDEKNSSSSEARLVSEAKEGARASLTSLNPVENANENVITEEELMDAEAAENQPLPPGMEGVIQDVWKSIISDDEDEGGAGGDTLFERIRLQKERENAESSGALKAGMAMDANVQDDEEDATLAKLRSTMADAKKKKEDGTVTLEEVQLLEKDEMEFPDEIEMHPDTVGRERYAKYRGLKSFRMTEWDTKQNLPTEYGHIFQFQNFQAAKRRILSEKGGGFAGAEAESGRRVRIEVVGVPSATALDMCRGIRPVMLWGLFKYERKVSVLHFLVKRHDNEDSFPLKAKDPMLFSVGFRRFEARPLYSQDCKSNKFKTDRYLQLGVWGFASVYARILLTPATVLMFRAHSVPRPKDGVFGETLLDVNPKVAHDGALVASGTLSSVDPDRLLIKRIVLTGAPISVSKRTAVVRHMFYRPEDVRWFKPVQLYTKHGMTGNILDAHGTKGYMKCTFDGHIKNHDTVCMSLFKRQYPPFDAKAFGEDPSSIEATSGY